MLDSGILAFAFIGLISFASQWLAWRVKLPAILFLLASGLIIGPVLQEFDPDALFGDLLFPLISLAVAIILFEGSLTLDLKEIRNQKGVVQKLITIGAAITWAVVAVTTHFLFGLSWELSDKFTQRRIVDHVDQDLFAVPQIVHMLIDLWIISRNKYQVFIIQIVVFEFAQMHSHAVFGT